MTRHCEEQRDEAIQEYRLPAWIVVLTLAITMIISLPFVPAQAGSSTVIEGPAGCTWAATVKKVGKSSISVYVDEQYGSCVDEECPVDAEGKTYSLTSTKYKPGQKIKIWVDLDKKNKERATLNIPKCWTQTVMLPQAPETIAPEAITPSAGPSTTDFSALSPVTSISVSRMSDRENMPPVEAFPPTPVTRAPLSKIAVTRE